MELEFPENSIFNTLRNPVKLAAFAYIISLVIIGAGLLLKLLNILQLDNRFPWLIMASMTLFYTVLSSVMSVAAGSILKAWRNTVYTFIGFILIGIGTAWLISGLSLYEAGTYRSIYIVIIAAFTVFLSIGAAIKGVVRFTERTDKKKQKRERNEEN